MPSGAAGTIAAVNEILTRRLLRAVLDADKPKTLDAVAHQAQMSPALVRRGLEEIAREHPDWLLSQFDASPSVERHVWFLLIAGADALTDLEQGAE